MSKFTDKFLEKYMYKVPCSTSDYSWMDDAEMSISYPVHHNVVVAEAKFYVSVAYERHKDKLRAIENAASILERQLYSDFYEAFIELKLASYTGNMHKVREAIDKLESVITGK